eukprot:gnl/Dysnectes_brevis/434_a477_4661.p1 GENE.gnl/Dysnectes_brevis/434_a477_4661~~gnl/Dysnectes_brevis/434_a477_4661.p1  ORF type:complete len:534 (-),score=192.78 gnl/Dysnectes_brevis/434_a477_4661:71-1672(-)
MGKPKSAPNRRSKRSDKSKYMTRNEAIKYLQLTLADFRRLCILKGIYPRVPKKKPKGHTTYYYRKDMVYISHEPILAKFREIKAHLRKVTKKLARGERTAARIMKADAPVITLDHIVHERYPTFNDAIRDLDDALTLVHMFATLPAGVIPTKVSSNCQRLAREWARYVASSGAIRKVFVTVKGVYLMAEINGIEVTWVQPHQFLQSVPVEVDFRVMRTFAQFYQTMLGFVLYRLYTAQLGESYPPKLSDIMHIGPLTPRSPDMVEEATQETDRRCSSLFEGLNFSLSREVPFQLLELIIRSGGGKVRSPVHHEDPKRPDRSVTHAVVDRPPALVAQVLGGLVEGRQYLQPQWALDSLNARCLLPVGPYEPGSELPPHLSPFVSEDEFQKGLGDGYVPDRQLEIQRIVEAARAREESRPGAPQSALAVAKLAAGGEGEDAVLAAETLERAHTRSVRREIGEESSDGEGSEEVGALLRLPVEKPINKETDEHRMRRSMMKAKTHRTYKRMHAVQEKFREQRERLERRKVEIAQEE